MTRGAFVGRVWVLYVLMVVSLVIWVASIPPEGTSPGSGFWSLSEQFGAMLIAGFLMFVGLLVAVILSLLTLLPTYRLFLVSLGVPVLIMALFVGKVGFIAMLEVTLQMGYAVLPFAVAGGALYGEKVRARLLKLALALVPPMLWYWFVQLTHVRLWLQTPALWPIVVVGDLVVIALFYWKVKDPA